jgi:alpha-glucosidase (family GH31 glycosyl hydrolase)
MRPFAVVMLAVLGALAGPAGARAAELAVESGSLRAVVRDAPWSVTYRQRDGEDLREDRGLALRDGAGVHRAVRARGLRREGDAVVAEVETDGGGTLLVRVQPAGEGVIAVDVVAPAGTAATAVAFAATPDERFYGTGERSDAVDRRGRETEHYVADGPFRPEDRQYVKASVPPWAERDRDDATYYPVPWVLSSRGWGVLVDEDVTSRVRAAVGGSDRWEAEADGARLRFRVFAGPTPAGALRRFTQSTGRQPEAQAPWTYGPWFQTGQPNVVPPEEEAMIVRAQRDAGAPVSVAETQMHHLPCGAHEGREEAERARTDAFHRAGLARLVYFNPSVCVSYREVYDRAAAAGALQRTPGGAPFAYPAFVGGSGPAGFTEEPLAQFDFTHPATAAIYGDLVREAVSLGADGWMEDFGESTPPSIVQHDGSTGDAAHNRYPVDYHCAVQRIARGLGRPLVRFQRSGWTGAARCAEVVWGGDPTTVWGFDGLSSAATQVLSIGLSGVSRWGTDIGGYNSFGAGAGRAKPGNTEDETLTPELLTRWIELGALVPVMRTKRSGIALPSYRRPQVYEPEHLPVWTRLTRLHHELNPYLRAADEEHRRSGLPIVRHLVLAHPDRAAARGAHDQWLLGPDLLAAPVTKPGERERRAWLPPGRWIDWWHPERILDGDREHVLPAPLGEPPLLMRAGAVLPLLPAGSQTLAPYGDVPRPDDRLRLVAAPRGSTFSRLGDGMTVRSLERRGRVVLRVRGAEGRRLSFEVSLRALRRGFRPRSVLVRGRRVRLRYSPGERVVRVDAPGGRVVRVELRDARRTRSRRR